MSGLQSGLRSLSNRQLLLSASFLTVALAGCMGTGARADNPLEEGRADGEEVELLVRNQNFSQATIYISPEHGSRRLGIVNGKSDATFKFPWHLPHIQLRVKFLAGGEFVTETLAVSPDDLLELQLPASRR